MLKGEEKGGLRNVLGLLDRETTGEHRTGFRKQNEAQEGELLKKEEGRDESNVVKIEGEMAGEQIEERLM